MDCKECKNKLIFYFENSLEKEEMGKVKNHIALCDECQSALNQLVKSFEIIEIEKQMRANPFLATRVIQNIQNRSNNTVIGLIRKLQPALFSLLLVVTLTLGILLGNLYQINNSDVYVSDQFEELYISDLNQENIELTFLTETSNE